MKEGQMPAPQIRVMVADDHDMFRSGMAILLEAFEDLTLAGMAADGHEVLELCGKIEPDVVLMDLNMPKMNGTVAIQTLRQRQPQVQVVALIGFGDEELVEAAMAAGAVGYVMKDAPIDLVARKIRAAARNASPDNVSSRAHDLEAGSA
jgi:NarL family two-component system response regulator LiaR